MSERVQIGPRIPAELKRLMDADGRTIDEIVEAALWTEFGGERDGALERQIGENQRRAAQATSEIEDRIEEIHGYARENHKLRSAIGGRKQQQREYAQELLKTFGGRVPAADNPAAENYAGKADMDVNEFVELMREVRDNA